MVRRVRLHYSPLRPVLVDVAEGVKVRELAGLDDDEYAGQRQDDERRDLEERSSHVVLHDSAIFTEVRPVS